MIREKRLSFKEKPHRNTSFLLWLLVPIIIIIVGFFMLKNTATSPTTESANSEEIVDSHTSEVANLADKEPSKEQTPTTTTNEASETTSESEKLTWSMKLVNEDISDKELDEIASLGITLLSGEWGIDEATPEEMLDLLDRTYARGMQWIINLTEGAAWGYVEDGSDPSNQGPEWQRSKITTYVNAIKHHPGIYGYDISNEAGENLPNGTLSYNTFGDVDDGYRITLAQMKEASDHIRSIAPGKPIMLRMHYWDEYDGTDFDERNPFGKGIADIVMLNLYSNYSDNRKTPALPNMIEDDGQKLVDKILGVDPDAEVWIALGTFQEFPLFIAPSTSDLKRDIEASLELEGITNIGFFGWGPERYPNEKPSYTLQQGLKELKTVIQSYAKS